MTHPDTERSIERLIKLAGERDMPSPAGMERARLAAHESWTRAIEKHGGRRGNRIKPLLGFALAAGLAAVALFIWHERPAPMAPEPVARIATLSGGATLREAHGETVARVALPVHAGATLATGEGRVALTFGDSLSLRMDRNTRLRFDDRGQVTLLAGSLYVDSGGVNAVPALRIETPAGAVRHVGTQFQVRVAGNTTSVRVREGRVLLTRSSDTSTTDIATGDELSVTGNELVWRRGLPSFGTDWEWSATIAPALEIENRPLAEFLAWMAREHGWQIRYADESLQQRTHDIRLHGSLDQLGTDAMLERVALVTGVPLTTHDGVLWVGGRQ
jgi:ferric-dicitrate binding protein FerR (iron transport regulator)